jgi:hypothetical protein
MRKLTDLQQSIFMLISAGFIGAGAVALPVPYNWISAALGTVGMAIKEYLGTTGN